MNTRETAPLPPRHPAKSAAKPTVKPAAKPALKRAYRKGQPLFTLLLKMKLWPSRSGQLHGIRTMDVLEDHAIVTTHCGKTFTVRNSRTSRAARWLRNKIFVSACPACGVPDWKLQKYTVTVFKKKSGEILPDRP